MLIDNISRGSQADRVLELFQDNPSLSYSASQVWGLVFRGEQVPLTSARRALTNLYNSGEIETTGVYREGLFERPEKLFILGDLHE